MSVPCQTCERIVRRDAELSPLWDAIYRATYWDVVHSYNTSLPGWLVLIARRHIAAIDELTDDEALELGKLIRQVSIALKHVTGCARTYIIQFAEATGHHHVHFHVVPRMANQPEDRKGPLIFGYLGVPETERVSEDAMNALAQQVRQFLLRAG